MRKIAFNYGTPQRAWPGRLLLVAGMVVAAAAMIDYLGPAREADRQEEQANMSAARLLTDAGAAARRQQEIDQANDVIRQLSLPWDSLFNAIESSATDKVALLSVQPDPQQRRVSLDGEAQSYGDVLAYMLKLDTSGTLAGAQLSSHQIKDDDPQHPVAFTVVARWRMAP